MFRPTLTTASSLASTWSRPLRSATFTSNAAISFPHSRITRITGEPAVNRIRKMLLYGLVGTFAVGISAVSYYEGAHLYIEHLDMVPETDPEVKKWEWDITNNTWTGDPLKGGTDPSLGYRARHLLRAAWAAYTQEIPGTSIIEEKLHANGSQTQVMHVVDARLQQAEHHLSNAIPLAQERLDNNKLNPSSFVDLLVQHARVSEQIGFDRFLLLARKDYERAWQYSSNQTYQLYIAWRLGDINSRLGNSADALLWWDRSSQLSQQSNHHSENTTTNQVTIPKSPLAQRVLSSILVSKSAHLAASGKLDEAQALEESALKFLRSIQPPDSMASASSPQALHALYLLQRSSLLSMHLAEVLHGQRQSVPTSIGWLASAAESSERVARILTGSQNQPSSSLDTENPSVHLENNQLLPIFIASRSMNDPARALLRDARRTVAEAWNMMGNLYEGHEGAMSNSALECYKRAVNWAGINKTGETTKPADDILDCDWKIYWGNYQRVKNVQAKSCLPDSQ